MTPENCVLVNDNGIFIARWLVPDAPQPLISDLDAVSQATVDAIVLDQSDARAFDPATRKLLVAIARKVATLPDTSTKLQAAAWIKTVMWS